MNAVVAPPAANTGWARQRARNAWLVLTPSATVSANPTINLRSASSRVAPWLTILAIIES